MIGGTIANNKNGVNLAGGTFYMTGGTLENNMVSYSSGSGISINGVGEAEISGGTITGSAFGVSVPNGTFKMSGGSVITNCGSAGVNVTGGTAKIEGGTITANPNGKGIQVTNNGSVDVSGGVITGNRDGIYVGYNDQKAAGRCTMSGGTVQGNGNGVWIAKGTFSMTGGTLEDNKVSEDSGNGIYVNENGTASMSGGTISGSVYGVTVNNGGDLTMTDGDITDFTIYGINIANGKVAVSGGTISGTGTAVNVCPDQANRFELSGAPVISGTNHDVFLNSNKYITITGEMSNEQPIGVAGVVPGTITNSQNTNYNDPFKFKSTNAEYAIGKNAVDGQLFLGIAPAEPDITEQPRDLILNEGYTDGSISVTVAEAAEGNTITYQWYSNTVNSHSQRPIAISDATDATYNIPTGRTAGSTVYYFCGVTSKRDDNSLETTVFSDISEVTVVGYTRHEAVPPTYYKDGSIEYYEDSEGNKYTFDGSVYTPVEDVTVPKLTIYVNVDTDEVSSSSVTANICIPLPDSDPSGYSFTFGGVTKAASECATIEIGGTTYYKMKVVSNAKEMSAERAYAVYNGEDKLAEGMTSVREYAMTVINGEYDTKAQDACRAMLSYGAAAQTFFGYDTDHLADAGLETGTGLDYSQADIPALTFAKEQLNAKLAAENAPIRYSGMTLILKDDTYISLAFKLNKGCTQEQAAAYLKENFRLDGEGIPDEDIAPNSNTKFITVKTKGLTIGSLMDDIDLTFAGETYEVNVGQYMYWAVKSSGDTALGNVCKALYNYWSYINK
ncbi:MAG: right-handed parallel beta-helix repeat-containing protein [Oscillospiraceae bacterium]|nr:right-handed parallel beta-helix repeat-containing protein [Oscillospiraceae bacterium]